MKNRAAAPERKGLAPGTIAGRACRVVVASRQAGLLLIARRCHQASLSPPGNVRASGGGAWHRVADRGQVVASWEAALAQVPPAPQEPVGSVGRRDDDDPCGGRERSLQEPAVPVQARASSRSRVRRGPAAHASLRGGHVLVGAPRGREEVLPLPQPQARHLRGKPDMV